MKDTSLKFKKSILSISGSV